LTFVGHKIDFTCFLVSVVAIFATSLPDGVCLVLVGICAVFFEDALELARLDFLKRAPDLPGQPVVVMPAGRGGDAVLLLWC
jgi:hypothetical protein